MSRLFGRRAATEQDATEVIDAIDPGTSPARSRSQGWRRLFAGNRVIWVMATVAIIALVAGLGLGQLIVSPGQAAADADAPAGGLITVPIENRTLANDVTMRGDATYADSVEVSIETGELAGAPIVTGQVPEVAAIFDTASIALEVTGRPVIVLPGDLPVYRTLRVGVSGPDVLQFKQGLNAAGIDAGALDSDVFDAKTASAVTALYAKVGYPAPTGGADVASAVSSAEAGVTSAQASVDSANGALTIVQGTSANVDVVEQGNLVRSAQRALADLQAAGTPTQIADAEDAVTLALARQAQALAPRDASAEKAAVTAAKAELTRAGETLSDARDGALAYLPAGEVLYLPGLPRRVDEISVKRGSSITGPVMRVSGATLVISGSATASDAALLEVGAPAMLAMPDGDQTATISSILPAEPASGETASGRFTVLFAPDALTDEQIQAVQGSNVRVRIPVSSTEGEVLAVPLAALTAGPGGESRVEFDPGDNAETVLVEVTTGLAAEGFVEITAVDGSLKAGDLVVVGR
ncbi:hypothetical protein SAMN05216368_105192 [Cryobacterium flavum]|uniref:Peptidoglycan binding domain-containing protein n=1 Tax=Cryobacterium flavum TaxID=1424659 RepID=A0A5E9FYV8_9MICO|nr:hypothetical protein [Cryobacterium flavum]SDN41764.1 hypothetical protein SAMN05216368_105192 [Cryobacterium flavum]